MDMEGGGRGRRGEREKQELYLHRVGVFLGSSVSAEEGRARLFGLMGRTETLRRDSWEMGPRFQDRGGARRWYTKARFQAGEHLGRDRELREGQRAEIAGRVVNPKMQGGKGRT